MAFYLHCLSIIMANPASTMSQQWADHEIEVILQYFIANKSEISYARRRHAAAAGTIPGQVRTSLQVQTKWQGVKADTMLLN